MKTKGIFKGSGAFVLALFLCASAVLMPVVAQNGRNGALSRSRGIIFTAGPFIELTAGAAVTAGQALYLDSAGKVQKLTSAQANNAIGVAYNTAANAATVQVQIAGVVTYTCDGNVAINDKLGATSLSVAGALKTLSTSLAVAAGGTTVTSSAANGAIVTGDPVTSRVLARALTACTDTGTGTALLLPN